MEFTNNLKKFNVAVDNHHGTLSVRIGLACQLYKALKLNISSEGEGTLAVPSHFQPGKWGETFVRFTATKQRNKIAAVRAMTQYAVALGLITDVEAADLIDETRHALKAYRATVRRARQRLAWITAQLGGTIQD